MSSTSELYDGPFSKGFRIFRIGFTLAVLFSSFAKGASFSIIGPTMIDMKYRLSTNYESLSNALLWLEVTSIFGALAASFITDRFRLTLDWQQAVLYLFQGIMYFALSIIRSAAAAAVFYGLSGLACGAIDVASYLIMFLLWGPKAVVFVNLLLAMQTIGGVTAAGYMQSYYNGDDFVSNINNSTNLNFTYNLVLYNESIAEATQQRASQSFVYMPYSVVALLLAGGSLSLFIIGLIPTPEQMKHLLQNTRRRSNSDFWKNCLQPDKRRVTVLCCGIITEFVIGASFTSFVLYLFSVAFESKIGFSMKSAATVNLIMYSVIAASRLISSILTKFIAINNVILPLTILLLVSDIASSIFGTKSYVNFWICAIFKSAMIGSVSSNITPFFDQYIVINGGVIALFNIMYNLGQVFQFWLNGYLLEHLNAWYNILSGLVFAILITIPIFVTFFLHRQACFPKSTEHLFKEDEEEECLIDDKSE